MMNGGFKSTQCSWGCSELSGMTQAQTLYIKSCKCSVFPKSQTPEILLG